MVPWGRDIKVHILVDTDKKIIRIQERKEKSFRLTRV